MPERQAEQAGLPGIAVRDSILEVDRTARPWRFRLSILLRSLAVVELVKGLVHWSALIGLEGGPDPLAGKSVGWLVANVFFAVADPVASVGLWIGAAWGVAIWLIAAFGQLAALALVPLPPVLQWALVALTVAAMAAYLVLSWKARRESD